MGFVEPRGHDELVEQALTSAHGGNGSTIVVSGTAASGKTTLLEKFMRRAAERGFHTLYAIGTRTERELPFGLNNQLHQHLPDWVPKSNNAIPQAVTGQHPLLICVDDLQHADALSLRHLHFLARRLHRSRAVMVLAGNESGEPADPTAYHDLTQRPRTGIRLGPFTRDEIQTVLRDRLGDVGHEFVTAFTRATGGSPLLVDALATDLETSAVRADADGYGRIRTGARYAAAIGRCLDRYDTESASLLRATAVLDLATPAALRTLGQLGGLDDAVVGRRLTELENAGLLRDGRLPHPDARAAVLARTPAADLTAAHRRAAVLLHADGAPPTVVGAHLLDWGPTGEPWTVAVLRDAASAHMRENATETAHRMLLLARDNSTEHAEHTAIQLQIMQLEWRRDPERVRHRLPQLAELAATEELSISQVVIATTVLHWFGDIERMRTILDAAEERPLTLDERSQIRFVRAWAAFTHPGLIDAHARDATEPDERTASIHETLARCLERAHREPPSASMYTVAEQTLQRCRLSTANLPLIWAALTLLIYADELDTAEQWCTRLLRQAAHRGAPTWESILAGIAAQTAYRQGSLDCAQRYAETARRHISEAGWGSVNGALNAVRLEVLTARGRLDEAAELLAEPPPEEYFHSIWSLGYLRARGRFYLSAFRVDAALEDFQVCRDLALRWQVDQPTVVPWRLDLATAYLASGGNARARTLIIEQLDRVPKAPGRIRGVALRLLAATTNLAQRAAVLRESVEALRPVGDDLETAWTLVDLSATYQAAGESLRARVTVRRAWQLAGECHADALHRSLLPATMPPDAEPSPGGGPDAEALESLSDAEVRVAMLAAQGSTNRQIANKLFVTISTVEQHLTRVYRKLQVNRRRDLLAKLPTELSNIA